MPAASINEISIIDNNADVLNITLYGDINRQYQL